jgi:hypothetical protein
MTIPAQADVDAVYAAARQGDAWPLPRPDCLYDFDQCDESALTALATLDGVRTALITRDGGLPSGKANCRLIDRLALDVITRACDEDDG